MLEGIEHVIAVAKEAVPPQLVKVEGVTYSPDTLRIVAPPLVTPIATSNSLQAVVDYVTENPDALGTDAMFIHIEDYRTVRVLGAPQAPTNQRPCFLTCTASERWNRMYKPDAYIVPRAFIVWMMSGFYPNADQEYALNLVASLKAEAVTEVTDNRVSQAVAVKRGVKSGLEEIRNPLKLAPYRTFPEVGPLESLFILRAEDNGDNVPKLILIDADPGNYEVNAVAAIKAWLASQLPDVTIIG